MELSTSLKQKIIDYRAPQAAIEPILRAPILLIVGATGAGKDTVQQELLTTYPDTYQAIISYTTRQPRQNNGRMEQDGVDYHFIDAASIERLIDSAAFVEANIVHGDNIYATGIADIQSTMQANRIAVTDIEVQGVRAYVDLHMNVRPVFLVPPSYGVWWERLSARYGGQSNAQELHKRMQTALMELTTAVHEDYFSILMNDDLHSAVDQINQIVQAKTGEASREPSVLSAAKQFLARIEQALLDH